RAKAGGSTKKEWNLGKLNSRENPLVFFTLITQAVIGAFAITFVGAMAGMETLGALAGSSIAVPFLGCLALLQALVLFVSTQHLGKPLRFYRGFNNLRYSPLSREALAVALFFGFLPTLAGVILVERGLFSSWLAVPAELLTLAHQLLVIGGTLMGVIGLYYMNRIYRIKARPFWDHWQVLSSFFGSLFSVGGMLAGVLLLGLAALVGLDAGAVIVELLPFVAVGLLGEAIGHICHARDLPRTGREGAASLQVLKTRFGKTHLARNIVLGICTGVALLMLSILDILPTAGWASQSLFVLSALVIMMTSLVSRALFYVIVIPTTMPGAFFWKYKVCEEHARETGLAKMPQVGVVELHH